MDEVEDGLHLRRRREGIIGSALGRVMLPEGFGEGQLVVEERSAEDAERRVGSALSELSFARRVYVLWESRAAEQRDVVLQMEDVLAIRSVDSTLKFYGHGAGLLLSFEGKGANELIAELERADVLTTGYDDLLIPHPSLGRRTFEDQGKLSDDDHDDDGGLKHMHSFSEQEIDRDIAVRKAKRSVRKTLAYVPQAVRAFMDFNRPLLSELGFMGAGGDELSDADKPSSPFSPTTLQPVYHIAKHRRGVAVTLACFQMSFDEEGRIGDPGLMSYAIQAGGLADDARRDAWPFIIGLFSWSSSRAEREAESAELRERYSDLVKQTDALECCSPSEAPVGSDLRSEGTLSASADYAAVQTRHEESPRVQVRKDVQRTDRDVAEYRDDDSPLLARMEEVLNVYAINHSRVGYCQERMRHGWGRNFLHGGTGIQVQLDKLRDLTTVADPDLAELFERIDPSYHCIYRWVVIHFRRELSFHGIIRLWEVMWLSPVPDIHLFVALGLLLRHRDRILRDCTAFDRLIKYINLMSERMDVDLALHDAGVLGKKYGSLDCKQPEAEEETSF